MGAEVSKAVKSDLEHSSLEELLSNEEFVERLRKAVPELDDNVRKKLCKLLIEETVPQQAAACTNTTTSGAGTSSSTSSDVASPTSSASSLGERALSNAAFVPDPRTRPLWEIKEEEVALPSEILDSFERWKADSSAFLRSGSLRVPESFTEHYDYALNVLTGLASSKILWRFITTTYYDIISELSHSDRNRITKEAAAFVVDVVDMWLTKGN